MQIHGLDSLGPLRELPLDIQPERHGGARDGYGGSSGEATRAARGGAAVEAVLLGFEERGARWGAWPRGRWPLAAGRGGAGAARVRKVEK